MISDARGGHVSPGVYTEVRDITYSTKSLGITTLGVAGETLKGPAFQPISIASWTDFTDYFGGTSPIKFKGTNYPKYELPYIAKAYLEESKQLEVVRVLGLSGYWAGKAWVISTTGSSAQKYHWEGKKVVKNGDNYQIEKDDQDTRKDKIYSALSEDAVKKLICSPGPVQSGKTGTADGQTGYTDVEKVSENPEIDNINMPVAVLRSKKTYSNIGGTSGICVESSDAPMDIVTNITISPYTGNTYGIHPGGR